MAKSTLAQEVSTGTSESFTDHELSDPAPHLALLRNRPTVGAVNSADDKATPVEPEFQAPPQVEPSEVEEVEQELDDFEAELELELEEEDEPEELVVPEPEPKPATPRKTAAKKATPARKRTDDF